MKELPKISIYYLSIGSGHLMAAKALYQAFINTYPDSPIYLTDPFENALDIFPELIEKLQSMSLLLAPDLYDNLWRRGVSINFRDWFIGNKSLQNLLVNELKNNTPDILITTHGLLCAIAASLRKETNIFKNLYGVLTDFGVHTFWPKKNIDGFFVPHEDVRNTFIYYGCNPNIIKVTGVPLRSQFEKALDTPLTITDKGLRVLILSGGMRSGAYVDMNQFVLDFLEKIKHKQIDLYITFVTGNQTQLKNKIEKESLYEGCDLNVVGFVDNMYEHLSTHDILITKPGGLIISEALATGICIILCSQGSGEASANAEFLARHGLAFRGNTPEEAIDILETCSDHPDIVLNMKEKAKKFGNPNSANLIVNSIMMNLNPIVR